MLAPIPDALNELIWRCVSKDPDSRPDSALTFLDELARIPIATPWTPADALRWWNENGPKVMRVEEPAEGHGVLTLDVEAGEVRDGQPNPRSK